MLNQLQEAYNKGLENLVFVDFSNKDVCGEKKLSEFELANQKACCQDVLQVINLHLRNGDYDSIRERIVALENSVDYMESLENQIKGKHATGFSNIADSLLEKGVQAKVVKFNAHQN